MFVKLLLLFMIVPMVELYLLIKLGSFVGALPTLGLVALTGVVGVTLAKSQGFKVISRIKRLLAEGTLPADSLIDALLILIGGVMLLTPGLLTDTAGFCLIIPFTRKAIRKIVKDKFQDYIQEFSYRYYE